MPEREKINITVKIGDRSYPMRIKPENEYDIRESVKNIHRELQEILEHTGRRDYQDRLSMLVLNLSMRLRDKHAHKENEAEQIAKLHELRKMIQQGIKNGEKPHN